MFWIEGCVLGGLLRLLRGLWVVLIVVFYLYYVDCGCRCLMCVGCLSLFVVWVWCTC